MLIGAEPFNIAVNYFDAKKFVRYNWVLVVTEFVVIRTQCNTNLSDNVDTHIELRRLPGNQAAPQVALAVSSRSVQVQLFDCKICTSPLQLYNNISLTRMHSSRMRTVRSSSRPGCGPEDHPPGCGPGDPPQARPLNFPPGCGPGDPPPGQTPQLPLGVGLETPPKATPHNFPPGCGPGDLQCMLGYHPPPLWTE